MCGTNNMPKKIVIQVQISCEKCRSKALKIAAETDGVNSIAIEGENKDKLVVIGDGIDSATLTCTLRKKLGFATIVTVQDEKPKDKKPEPLPVCIPSICYPYPPTCQELVVCDPNPSPCSIL
ncbi:hypothetical protein SLE2022_019920 [Rubroshorea leprosula]